jgi:hypothetical protein
VVSIGLWGGTGTSGRYRLVGGVEVGHVGLHVGHKGLKEGCA